jgi:hypothetical protein
MSGLEPCHPSELEATLYSSSLEERLGALRQLCARVGERPRRGTNAHIHTNESFSAFRSVSAAVWQAAREGLAVLGINDHYTVAGYEEFRRACEIAGIAAVFSLEAVAMDRAAEASRTLLNDPDNPGRVYLCGKGVTRIPPDCSAAMRSLARMRAALERRNREMVAKVAQVFRERLGAEGPTWEAVRALTPRGNTTERHVAWAALLRLRALAAERQAPLGEIIECCCGTTPAALRQAHDSTPPNTIRCGALLSVSDPAGAGREEGHERSRAAADDAALQIFVRSKLLKAGAPCYVPESEEAFVSSEELREIFLAFGSIPTYPVLGNPITSGERDIQALLDRLEAQGFYAIEVIPHRNTRERLAEIVSAARRRWWPVFNGTEHNTPESRSLLDPFALDPEFEPWFRQSTAVLLSHQARAIRGEPGFVDENGRPTILDARARFEFFSR